MVDQQDRAVKASASERLARAIEARNARKVFMNFR